MEDILLLYNALTSYGIIMTELLERRYLPRLDRICNEQTREKWDNNCMSESEQEKY